MEIKKWSNGTIPAKFYACVTISVVVFWEGWTIFWPRYLAKAASDTWIPNICFVDILYNIRSETKPVYVMTAPGGTRLILKLVHIESEFIHSKYLPPLCVVDTHARWSTNLRASVVWFPIRVVVRLLRAGHLFTVLCSQAEEHWSEDGPLWWCYSHFGYLPQAQRSQQTIQIYFNNYCRQTLDECVIPASAPRLV